MANWNLPTINSNYLDFVTEINDKFVDAGTIGFGSPINLPDHSIRFNRSINLFEELVSSVWEPKVLSIAGGGTGSTTAAGIRTNLGLGSMATQNSNAVNITGGVITGVAFSASDITAGIIALARGGTGASLSLGAAGTVLLSNGTNVVFAQGTSISQLNASNLTTGIVPAARLSGVGLLASDNSWTGVNVFSNIVNFNAGYIAVVGGYPIINLHNTIGVVGSKRVQIINYLGDIYFQKMNDDGSFGANLIQLRGDGAIIGIGSYLTNLNASSITIGTVPTINLGAGSPDSTTFLRGDGVWAIPSSTPVTPVPAGLIGMFTTNCPAGWSRVAELDGRFPIGSTGWGSPGGSSSHRHSQNGNTSVNGDHNHSFSGSGSGTTNPSGDQAIMNFGSVTGVSPSTHVHTFSYAISGNTGGGGNHNHSITHDTNDAGHMPPYLTVVFCMKN